MRHVIKTFAAVALLANAAFGGELLETENHLELQIQEAIQHDLQRQLGTEIQVTLPRIQKASLSVDHVALHKVSLHPGTNRFTAQILLTTGQDQRLLALKGHLSFMRKIPILTSFIPKGHLIPPDAISWQWSPEKTQGAHMRHAMTTPEALYGAIADTDLEAGSVLTRAKIRTESAVKRGDTLSVVYRIPHMEIVLGGAKALQSGNRGDTITLSNPHPKRGGHVLSGVIESAHRVCVSPT